LSRHLARSTPISKAPPAATARASRSSRSASRRRRFETEPQVEARCGLVDRVGRQTTDASLVCN